MLIVHCADIHLGARTETNLDADKAAERRKELLLSFGRMADDAERRGARVVLIAGDLFDRNRVSSTVSDHVCGVIEKHENIIFIYLAGNHDDGAFSADQKKMPENLLLVGGSKWEYLDLGGVTLAAISPADDDCDYPNELSLDKNRRNIVMLHGSVSDSPNSMGSVIGIGSFRGRGIDYMALGHYHSFSGGAIDERGIYRYSGCLAGRGFDECGQKGYVLLDIGEDGLKADLIPLEGRRLHEISVDVSGCEGYRDFVDRAKAALSEIPASDMVKLVLSGSISEDAELDAEFINKELADGRFFIKTVDKTTLAIDPERCKKDATLKGGFTRMVLESGLSPETEKKVLMLGISALMGREI